MWKRGKNERRAWASFLDVETSGSVWLALANSPVVEATTPSWDLASRLFHVNSSHPKSHSSLSTSVDAVFNLIW